MQKAKDLAVELAAGGVRVERERREQFLERVHLRPRAGLLLALRRAGERCDGEQTLAAAKKYLLPNSMIVIAVGIRPRSNRS
jgi:hypothetical protein